MIEEKKAQLQELKGKKSKEKEMESILSDMKFIEVELLRYQQGMSLFRLKDLPKVGRWGRPKIEEQSEE
jgi:hypothetical protein